MIHRNTPCPPRAQRRCSRLRSTSRKRCRSRSIKARATTYGINQFHRRVPVGRPFRGRRGQRNSSSPLPTWTLTELLKVTAEGTRHRAAKAVLKIENAVSRFRRESNQDAKQAARLPLKPDIRPVVGGPPASPDVPPAADRCSCWTLAELRVAWRKKPPSKTAAKSTGSSGT